MRLPPGLLCGPGTVERDGVCALEDPVATCGAGTVLRGDTCVALGTAELALPFVAGTTVAVIQGAHGYYSHSGLSVNAVDFAVDEGTEVVAARAGRVVELREDSDTGCPEPGCSALANFLVIDHGDATFGQYWHLALDGVLVEVGDRVGQGQVVALSGNTGWTTGPHLHLQVRDPLGQSLPMLFLDQPGGDVFAGGTFVSGNEAEAPPDTMEWSTCPPDILGFMGVTLDRGVPCSMVESRRDYVISGISRVPDSAAVVGAYSVQTDLWTLACEDVVDGSFASTLRWTGADFRIRTYLIAGAADPEDCLTYQGWDASIYLTVAP